MNAFRSTGTLSALLLIGYVLNVLNLSNPGYLSSDDLNLGLKGFLLSHGYEGRSFFLIDAFMYRPLREYFSNRIAMFVFDYPFLLHATLVTLHLIASLLFAWLVWLKTRSSYIALAAYLLAVVFPTSQHVINNFAALADQQVAFFALAIALVVLWREQKPFSSDNALAIAASIVAVGLFMALALLSKESAVVFPAMLLIYIVIYRRFQLLDLFLVLATLSALYFAVRVKGLYSVSDPTDNYHTSLDYMRLFWNAVRYYTFPFMPKRVFIGNVPLVIHTWYFIAGAVGFATLAVLLLVANWRAFLVIGGCSLAILAPLSTLGTVGEHQLYIFGLLVICAMLCVAVSLRWLSAIPIVALTTLAIMATLDRELYFRKVGVMYERSNASLVALVASELAMRPEPAKTLDVVKMYFGGAGRFELPLFEDWIVIRMQPDVGEQRYWLKDILHDRLFARNEIAFTHPIIVAAGNEPVDTGSARVFALELRADGYLVRQKPAP